MSKIKLVPPEGVTCASFDGVEYPVDKDGCCTVPAEAALQLYQFGFGNAPDTTEAPAEGDKPETAAQKKAREKAEAEAKTKEGAGDGNAPAAPAADSQ